MPTTIDRAEINRRNAQKSTGPRTSEGKARSRFNAVKHGCRARLPILPGEDAEAYQARLDAWVGKFGPRDAVEHYLVERAVHVSWQLDRADRAEVARLAEEIDADARTLAEEVAELGATLFRTPAGRIGDAASADGDADGSPLSWPFDPEHSQHPSRLVAALEATAVGCDWLLDRWAELGRRLDAGQHWRPLDRLRAIRLLGKQPLDVVADAQLMAIYLACHAMEPDGPDVFTEPLRDLTRPEMRASHERLSRQFAAARSERAPREAAEGRATLRAIVAAAVARAEALREVRAAAEAAGAADISARLSFYARETVEWLRKHQVTCSRALFRTFDELRKVRRDFGEGLPTDEPEVEPWAPGPTADATPAHEPCAAEAIGGEGVVITTVRHAAPPSFSRVVIPEQEARPAPLADDSVPIAAEAVVDHGDPTSEASHPETPDAPAGDGQVSLDRDVRNATNEANNESGDSERSRADGASAVLSDCTSRNGVDRDDPSAAAGLRKAREQCPVGCSPSTGPPIGCPPAPPECATTHPPGATQTSAGACLGTASRPPNEAASEPSG